MTQVVPLTTTPMTRIATACLAILAAAGLLSSASCGAPASATWAGSIDTLATGQLVVHNPATPLWTPGERWTLTPELRIGTMDREGPDLFGQITSLAVDGAGRIYVLEGQAQEIRVFGPDGTHIRTIGRKGGGPGEFARALRIEMGPDGRLWVADPQNNRVSVFDTTGRYLRGHTMAGGFTILPWPGRFDRQGRYYYPMIEPAEDGDGIDLSLIRYDSTMTPTDTLATPDDPVDRNFFELRHDDNVAIVGVPYTGGFRWLLSPAGTFWGFITGPYRIFELSPEGDTLRTITRAFDPLPVTDEDMAEARENLEWFIQEGGAVDWSRIPDHKPAIEYGFVDDAGRVWVWPVMPSGQEGTALDVFDSVGRYLGRIMTPVPIARRPAPVVRGDVMYAVTESELDVPFVVRLRIQRPTPVVD